MSSGPRVVEEIAGNVVIARRSFKGQAEVCRWFYLDFACKEQWWVPNICGEEFQHVGRTIFIKSKMLLFPYTLMISTQILKILTSFYQVIILLKVDLSTVRGYQLSNSELDFLNYKKRFKIIYIL
jgi:hypothetical protein